MLRLSVSFLTILSTFVFMVSAQEKIAVAAFEYQPIYQNGADKGSAGDLVSAAFKAVNIETEFQFVPVPRMVKTVADGQAVCGIGGKVLFETPEVAPKVTVSEVVQYVSQVFVYDSKKFPGGFKFDSLAEMSKYTIGVLASSGINKFLDKTKNLKIEPNTTHDGTAKQLQIGRVDVWAIVDLTGLLYMKNLFPAEASSYKYTKAFNRGDVSVVFSKALDPDGKYSKKFAEGLAIIKKNGTYMNIMAKYYGGVDKINKEALTDDMK